MEGVPRLYMIGMPVKRFREDWIPEFALAISHQIQNIYDQDPTLYADDIDAMYTLRAFALEAVRSNTCTAEGCMVLKRYYAHLVRLTEKFPRLLEQKRFPMDEYVDYKYEERGPLPPVMFSWNRYLGGRRLPRRIIYNKQDIIDHKNSIARDEDEEVKLGREEFEYGSIRYEMQCVLYNLGAAQTRLAAALDRSPPLVSSSTSENAGAESPSNTALKMACSHLQCAAWAFQEVLSHELQNEKLTFHQKRNPLVANSEYLTFAYNIALAQAQECILEKSMMDARKSLIIAKISAMVCEYYATAVEAVCKVERKSLASPTRTSKWRLYTEFKCRYYGAVTALFQGQHAQDQLQQMGTRVSYYRRAVNLLGRAGQISENCSITSVKSMYDDDDSADDDYYYYLDSKESLGLGQSAALKESEMRRDTLSFAMDVAAAKWRAAKSENELIYHEPVVPVLSDEDDSQCLGKELWQLDSATRNKLKDKIRLEKVKGASLVKPIKINIDDPELYTTTLFKNLVPTATRHQAALYRNEKRAMEVEVQSICQEADRELNMFITNLNLEILDLYKDNHGDGKAKNDVVELPQQLVNCCAAYQAVLQRHKKGLPSCGDEEKDQLDISMSQLSDAVQTVDSMLDEIDQLLKTEELGDSEYRRTLGQPYDYSAGRMPELRREATRYREAHVGRAKDSWVTLSTAYQNRRHKDLQLLALPPAELAAKLPPARPTKCAIAIEAIHSLLAILPDNDVHKSDESKKRMIKESLERMDRLNLIINKVQEVREQRLTLLSRLKDEMEQEEKDDDVAGQDDSDVLEEERRESEVNIIAALKKKLDGRYGKLMNCIERNITAQSNVLEAVRVAYVKAGPERRAYTKFIKQRQTAVKSLIDAYESFAAANGETPLTTSSETMTSGLLSDTALVERCAKGLDFYQRLVTNVSKLLQRVKGACQVQTEQRDQILKQQRQLEAETQGLDNNLVTPVSGLDDPLTSALIVDNQDHNQNDLAALIDSFSANLEENKSSVSFGSSQWDHQLNHLRRLSPLGSEQQRQHNYHQINSLKTNQQLPFTFTTDGDYCDSKYDDYQSNINTAFNNQDGKINLSTVNQQPTTVLVTSTSYPATLASVNSVTSLPSPLSSSASMPYNYYNYKLPIAMLPLHNNIVTNNSAGTISSTAAMMNSLNLGNNGSIQSVRSPHTQSNNSDISRSSVFTNAAQAVAVLQRPLTVYSNSSNASGISYGSALGYSYQNSTSRLPSVQHQQFNPQQISMASSITGDSTGFKTNEVFLQQHQLITGSGSGMQSSLSLTSPLISKPNTNNSGLAAAAVAQSPSITDVSSTSTVPNFFQQQQQTKQLQFYQHQTQQLQLYQQQQQAQLYQHLPQMYQQQPQQQSQQLLISGGNTTGNMYYQPEQQQQQMSHHQFQTHHQQQPPVQSTTALTTDTILANLQHSQPSNNISYYQQLQQYHPPGFADSERTRSAQLKMAENNYYYQHPIPVAFNQPQQQQLPLGEDGSLATCKPVNLLDDDLLLSGPPPIQPEKIGSVNNSITSKSLPSSMTTNNNSK